MAVQSSAEAASVHGSIRFVLSFYNFLDTEPILIIHVLQAESILSSNATGQRIRFETIHDAEKEDFRDMAMTALYNWTFQMKSILASHPSDCRWSVSKYAC